MIHKSIALMSLLMMMMTAQAQQFASRDQRYTLKPSDVLELRYRYTPEFNETVTIMPDGYITIQLVGDVKVGDLSLDEARDKIVELASARLRDPELILTLKEFEKPHYFVAGHVANPGKFDMRGEVTAVQAIAMAGGFTPSAKHKQVILYRQTGPDVAEAKLLDMKQMMSSDGLQEDPQLRSGDLLVVPQNKISKIERIVHGFNLGMGVYTGTR